jgi:hypothetical protein
MTGPFLTLATIAGAVVIAALTWSYLEGRKYRQNAETLLTRHPHFVDAYFDDWQPDPRVLDLFEQEKRGARR